MSEFEPVMLPVDLHDVRITTALHEAGHVLAYLDAGQEFDDVIVYPTVRDGLLGEVRSHGSVPVITAATLAMAGPAVNALMAHGSLAPDAAVVDWVLETLDEDRAWQAEVDAGIEEPLGSRPGDTIEAGEWAEVGLLSALPLVATTWHSIEAIAGALLTLPDSRLTYEEVLELLPDSAPDDSSGREWLRLVAEALTQRQSREDENHE